VCVRDSCDLTLKEAAAAIAEGRPEVEIVLP
jgi:hypothetical protein